LLKQILGREVREERRIGEEAMLLVFGCGAHAANELGKTDRLLVSAERVLVRSSMVSGVG
jgi:hypothetical protein